MKITITACTNRIGLIKFFRSSINNFSMQKSVNHADHLPYVYTELSKADAREIEKELKDCAIFSVEEDAVDSDIAIYTFFNSNINLPQEYFDALAWYDTCSEEHKKHIDQLVLWKNRPACC